MHSDPHDKIVIVGAREHNLKNISLALPRNKLIVLSGVSGSGKSTLAFDTIYAEGQRRYVESLSAYARQFLEMMDKPDVDKIDGLSPAISIEQRSASKNPRSTVGTVTEIYDYLRLLFARIGVPYCPECGKPIAAQSAQMITERISVDYKGLKVQILAPLVQKRKGTFEGLFSDLKKEGFATVRVDGKWVQVASAKPLPKYFNHTIELLIDETSTSDAKRLAEAVEACLDKAGGLLLLKAEKNEEVLFSSKFACPTDGTTFEELQPRMFSFNSPFGACEECKGLGVKQEFDPDLVIPDRDKTIAEGAIAPYGVPSWFRAQELEAVARHIGFDINRTKIKDLKPSQLNALLYGTSEKIRYNYKARTTPATWYHEGAYEGVIRFLERVYRETQSDWRREEMERFIVTRGCPSCKGRRLKTKVLAVKIGGLSIAEVTALPIDKCRDFFRDLKLDDTQHMIAKQVLKQIVERLGFLSDVGLNYLTLDRTAETLSGGEAQRIRLATQIGSNLVGVLYVLDEPSIGLHARDEGRLISTLKKLRDLGNTVIVVEHDEDTILSADWVVDIGPGAGVHGGHIVAQGTPDEIKRSEKSITGRFLSGKESVPLPKARRKPNGWLHVLGASQNNLHDIDVHVPLGVMTAITGVSGSGKSTLINDVLYRGLMRQLFGAKELPGKYKTIKSDKPIDKVLVIDQEPIGRTPRSNPATYTKVFDEIRMLFSSTFDARERGYTPGRFSFNLPGGRCETCEGDGVQKIEMQFLPDVYIECPQCKGRRYNRETLEVRYKGKNVSDVLKMTVDEALKFFENVPQIERRLRTLSDVGLGYIMLGQSATTLSGGEAQRIKLTRELSKRPEGHTLYILDEPTTGLHFADVRNLLGVLGRLVDNKGHSVLIIEHNLDVVKTADYIIDLGPDGGEAGGRVVAAGTPEEIAAKKAVSYTGQYLEKLLQRHGGK